MLLSAFGLALSVFAHFMALAGVGLPGGGLVTTLDMGIFVVWIPTVLVSIRTTRYVNRKDFWKVALSGCPVWMRRAFYVFFVYGILNFILFVLITGSGPQPAGDAAPSVVRGFAGHWMIFYAAAFATLYSAIHAPNLFRERKCPKGHAVAPTAHLCPECGYAFPSASVYHPYVIKHPCYNNEMNHKPVYVSGLHNIGYVVAFASWIICLSMSMGHFFYEGDFKVLARRTECEQPLNNRCVYIYRVQEQNGNEYETKFGALRVTSLDLAVGNRFRKERHRLDYWINDKTVVWDEGPQLFGISLVALLPFWISRRLTPARPL
jgi:hypothetical protein